jgi:hypothetical protein
MKRLIFSIVCACAVSAVAQEVKSNLPKPAASPIVSSEDHVQALREYWTPERLAAARPLPIPMAAREAREMSSTLAAPEPMHTGGGGRPTAHLKAADEPSLDRFPLNRGEEDDTEAVASPESFSYEMPFNNFRTGVNNQYPYSAIGKLFFVIPEGASEPAGDYVCSAAVAGVQNYIVVTARHCVFDYATSKWYSNWVFYPGWDNGSNAALGGAWYPNVVATWVSSSTLSLTTGWDVAMMTMHDSTGRGCGGDSGHTIGSITGWLGYSYGGDFSQRQWNIFGYPQAAPFEGNYLYQDNGATGTVNPLGTTNVVEVGNPQTGGTSGGPWVIGFNPNDATDPNPNNNTNPGLFNLENGVNSFKWTSPNQPLSINGTVFTQANYWNLYTYLNGIPCK